MIAGGAAPWVLATRNVGKLRELRALLEGEGISVRNLDDAGVPETIEEEGIECHDSFAENAVAKARYFAARLPGLVVIADDSGLEVRSLGGQPGVHSRRWSGRSDLSGPALDAANNARLVRELAGVPDRRARFVCAAAFVGGGREIVTAGEVAGTIIDSPSGREGFGYDPHFHVDELGLTLGDATVAEKQRVSHRGRAFSTLLRQLRQEGILAGAV